MPVEHERTLEVVNLPPSVDTELLKLYFTNKRRSGGGPLVSVEKKADRAILVFEETEAAARVLRQEGHTLQNMALIVRKPACKDQQRLLLRGISPSTSEDLIELYVENMLGLNQEDYQLLFTPARDSVLIQLSQPLSEDFQSLSDNISQRSLNGASMALEEIEQTDSVLVGNLHPDTSLDMLCLYFEGSEENHTVLDVTRVSESSAKVSFADHASVDLVLTQPHKLKGADLEIRPYFDILQPTPASPGQSRPPSTAGAPPPSSQMPSVVSEEEVRLTEFISLPDPAKLDLFQLGDFQQEVKKISPDITIEVRHNGVYMEAADRQTFERVKDSLLEYFCQMSESRLTLEPEEAEFLNRTEVKQQLQTKLKHMPAVYVVLDRNAVVTALSCTTAQLASCFLKCQLAHTTIPMDTQYKCIFSSSEWADFLEALSLSSVKVSAEAIDILTLKGMESEKHAVILDFLLSHLETEVVVCMEPGVLKYIQTHCHQIVVCMDQVSMVPLESTDVSGLKIYGHPVACSTAQEMLEDIISCITAKTFTVSAPGITRYLLEEECKMFLSDMEKMSQVCILIKQQPWEPPAEQDIFQAACTQISTRNFKRVSADAQKSVAVQNNHDGVSDLLENAKMVISAITDEAGTDQYASLGHVDLYTAGEDKDEALDASGANALYTSEVNVVEDEDEHSPNDLEENAKLSLAIQYSIESCQQALEGEEELQTVLMLSKEMSQHDDLDCTTDLLNEALDASLEEAVKAANTIQLHVFGTQDSNLLEVETAFKKSISQKQMVEKLHQHADVDMGEYNRKCLEAIERKHGVEIQVEGTIINISGFRKFVSEALCDMKLLVDRLFCSVSDQEILKNVQWVFHDPVFKTTTPYSPDVIVFLENAWKMKMEKVDILLDNQLHIMNFRDMHEHNPASGESVTISRESIDSVVVDDNQAEQKHSQLTSLPNATKVDEGSSEFHLVREMFNKTIQKYHSKIRIVRVDKLLNQLLYDQYQLKKRSIQKDADDAEFEKTLYHGTREETVKEICLRGFDRSFCGMNAALYGQGVYFAVSAALSLKDRYSPPNAVGHKFVFMSKVLTGNYTNGCKKIKTAPLKKGGEIPIRYDSVTDNVNNPEIFVIFNDTQAFPEYLITCEKI